jgi:hypothetical protein
MSNDPNGLKDDSNPANQLKTTLAISATDPTDTRNVQHRSMARELSLPRRVRRQTVRRFVGVAADERTKRRDLEGNGTAARRPRLQVSRSDPRVQRFGGEKHRRGFRPIQPSSIRSLSGHLSWICAGNASLAQKGTCRRLLAAERVRTPRRTGHSRNPSGRPASALPAITASATQCSAAL